MASNATVEGLHAAWVDAFNSHDLDRHMTLYTEDAVLFGSVAELQVGRETIRTYFSKRGPGVHVVSYPMPLVKQLSEYIAMTAGHVDFADGNIPMPYRMTWVLVRQDGGWRIIQHHGSPRV